MTDDVLISRAATIVRGVKRAREAALDMGQHLIRRERLGVPQSARDVFTLLAQGGWIDNALANSLKRWSAFATSPCITIRPCN